ncbi:GAF and ANTAR domain-containing protein [Arthrobacter sp. PM3]|uniref:GAF and ANTAR domain-containing protein n=1 Tax=Arthrobacter sp. PM3 TaxID=2017685 RepID=UPI000E100A67|nr:GAF and ANTAR domain-containing protein [Arthrobacter sp. PM3]AXJ08563.1 response regulator receiver protein [Arthrobacter sp. PM3]
MVNEPTANSINQHLHELVLSSTDVEEFLGELARTSARSLSEPGDEVLCGITLLRHRKAATVASSSPAAQAMDEIQYSYGDGPCMTASREQETVHIEDLERDARWPQFAETVRGHGFRSILALPFLLEGDTRAALNLYSHRPGRFDARAISLARNFVHQTSLALRLAVRFAHSSDTAAHLKATLETRTGIDVAVGIIMAQNRCSQDEAFELLKSASSARNVKLHAVAAGVVESLGQGPARTHFEV